MALYPRLLRCTVDVADGQNEPSKHVRSGGSFVRKHVEALLGRSRDQDRRAEEVSRPPASARHEGTCRSHPGRAADILGS
jgi:hypothetical protein